MAERQESERSGGDHARARCSGIGWVEAFGGDGARQRESARRRRRDCTRVRWGATLSGTWVSPLGAKSYSAAQNGRVSAMSQQGAAGKDGPQPRHDASVRSNTRRRTQGPSGCSGAPRNGPPLHTRASQRDALTHHVPCAEPGLGNRRRHRVPHWRSATTHTACQRLRRSRPDRRQHASRMQVGRTRCTGGGCSARRRTFAALQQGQPRHCRP
jgi:hypothetical protein